jgi:hypothetical protein
MPPFPPKPLGSAMVRSRNLRSTRPWPGLQLQGELGHAVVIKLAANVATDEVKDRSGLAVMSLQDTRAVKESPRDDHGPRRRSVVARRLRNR